jgi:DNA primase
LKEKITRQFIIQLNKMVKIDEFMESEYDSDFVYSKNSGWANTNCPMPNHNDSSPSFGVNLETNTYNCFGCGASGDIIKLIQSVEGFNFIEAVQKLSLSAGIEVETVNLDMKYLVNEFQNKIHEYLKIENTSLFPGGLNEISFMFAMSEKSKRISSKYNQDPQIIKWIDEQYKIFDDLMDKKDYINITTFWKNYNKNLKEHVNELAKT